MSAETLRRAAATIRDDWDNDADRRTFPKSNAYNLAVADWLDEVAEDCEYDDSPAYMRRAIAVARAYLGESA